MPGFHRSCRAILCFRSGTMFDRSGRHAPWAHSTLDPVCHTFCNRMWSFWLTSVCHKVLYAKEKRSECPVEKEQAEWTWINVRCMGWLLQCWVWLAQEQGCGQAGHTNFSWPGLCGTHCSWGAGWLASFPNPCLTRTCRFCVLGWGACGILQPWVSRGGASVSPGICMCV